MSTDDPDKWLRRVTDKHRFKSTNQLKKEARELAAFNANLEAE